MFHPWWRNLNRGSQEQTPVAEKAAGVGAQET